MVVCILCECTFCEGEPVEQVFKFHHVRLQVNIWAILWNKKYVSKYDSNLWEIFFSARDTLAVPGLVDQGKTGPTRRWTNYSSTISSSKGDFDKCSKIVWTQMILFWNRDVAWENTASCPRCGQLYFVEICWNLQELSFFIFCFGRCSWTFFGVCSLLFFLC